MARPSPSRQRSHPQSSPERGGFLSDFLSDDRNSALSHKEALDAAHAEHARVRDAAIRVFELHELEEERRRIELAQRKEHDRLRIEAELVAEEKRLRALRAQSVPRLPPEQEIETVIQKSPAPSPPSQRKPELNGHATTASSTAQPRNLPTAAAATPTSTSAQPFTTPSRPFPPSADPLLPNPLASALKTQPNGATPTPSPFSKPPMSSPVQLPPLSSIAGAGMRTPNPLAQGPQAAAPPQRTAPQSVTSPDRYVQIHQALKKLRKDVVSQSKVGPMKGRLGEMRRDIRKSIGQLTDVKGANAAPVNKIVATLKESIDGRLPSPLVDVSVFVAEARVPVEGSAFNDAQLPSLFLYLLNMLAKAIISQFINECSAKPETADPIGVVTAQIFSQKDFQWRGKSLIDILMAKFRVVCPVLFGYRASESTQAGRAILGWKQGVDERTHKNRMVGLGTGYASIALRDFSKASKVNPYPPSNYWKAMAFIVNSPPQEVSDTQFTVLKAMIDGHEQRFITFYGNAALAALRMAIVTFPHRAPKKTTTVGALVVLGEVLKRDRGINLY